MFKIEFLHLMYSIKANNEHVYLIVFQDFQTSKLL